MGRIEEVDPEETCRMVHAGGQLGDAERGRVRRENGVLTHPLFQESEQAPLDVHRFWSRFDDQLRSLHGKSQVGASLDSLQDLIAFLFGEFPRGDDLIEILSDQFEPGIDRAEVHVVQDRVDARQGTRVCDPVPHGAGSEYGHTLKVHSHPRPTVLIWPAHPTTSRTSGEALTPSRKSLKILEPSSSEERFPFVEYAVHIPSSILRGVRA